MKPKTLLESPWKTRHPSETQAHYSMYFSLCVCLCAEIQGSSRERCWFFSSVSLLNLVGGGGGGKGGWGGVRESARQAVKEGLGRGLGRHWGKEWGGLYFKITVSTV